MASVIANTSLGNHTVNKYNFKVIASGLGDEVENPSSEETDTFTEDNNPKARATDIDSSSLSSSSKESLIESLMQKTDEMSSNFIKLQMKLESKEEEYKLEIVKAKEEAFAEGIEAGVAKAGEDSDSSLAKTINQFSTSVGKLEESAQEFEKALEGIKNELVSAAVDIAREVVKVELSDNSNEVAKILSDELLKELQSASKITIKVNPNNHGVISEHIGKMEHITIVSDSAVSEGGVIVMSDAGNIDSQISKRFDRVKKAALSE